MNYIDEIADYLANQGLGTVGTNIFSSYLPQTPDNCMAIFDTGGGEQDIDLPLKNRTFQVIVRSTNYTDGRTKMDTVRSSLHQKKAFEVYAGQTHFLFIHAQSEGGHIGQDQMGRDGVGRDEFSINFVCKTR